MVGVRDAVYDITCVAHDLSSSLIMTSTSTTTTPSSSSDVHLILGLNPTSTKLKDYLGRLHGVTTHDLRTQPDVKAYSDAVYFNYYFLGLSLMFAPMKGYKIKSGATASEIENELLYLDSIDLYNAPTTASSTSPAKASTSPSYSTFAGLPLSLSLSEGMVAEQPRPAELVISSDCTGKDFVGTIGEPDRKGGGGGPSAGAIGIWCEWSKDGIMVEFGGNDAKGPQAWEKGKDATWKVITVFTPK
jgi:hypothetical protein